MSATPETINEKAKGMPSAMAASNETMKTRTVIWRPLGYVQSQLLQSLAPESDRPR